MESIKISLQISDMMCEGCQENIRNTLQDLEGIESLEVSLEHKNAEISYNPDKLSQDKINEAINEAGYSVDSAKQLA